MIDTFLCVINNRKSGIAIGLLVCCKPIAKISIQKEKENVNSKIKMVYKNIKNNAARQKFSLTAHKSGLFLFLGFDELSCFVARYNTLNSFIGIQ